KQSGGRWFSSGAVDGTNVYLLNQDGLVQAFDQVTGDVRWSTQLRTGLYSSPPTIENGTLYVDGSEINGSVYAIDPSTGSVRWESELANGDHSSPAVTADGVYVTVACDNHTKFDPDTG